MAGFLDKAAISFSCPKCGRAVKTTVGAGRRSRSVRCPGGHMIEVDGSQLNRAAREAEASLERTMRRLR